jgi:predicted acetyltransferase
MMEIIRELRPGEMKDFMNIVLHGYPRFGMPLEHEALGFSERILQASSDPSLSHFGLFMDEELLGVMRCHDLSMNFHGKMIPVGGMGLLAVDLLHKKEHVAKRLMEFYHELFLKKGACMTLLYPFDTYFYRRMGYGYGSKMHQYRINPLGLPRGGSKRGLRYLTPDDRNRVVACYDRVCSRTHGMCGKAAYEVDELFDGRGLVSVGHMRDGMITGYLTFHFQRGVERRVTAENRYINDVYVHELIHEDTETLYRLLGFLRTQADQIGRIVYRTQDDYFHHLLLDITDGSRNIINPLYHQCSVEGVGLMYRIIDVEGVIAQLGELDCGTDELTFQLQIRDSFLPRNSRRTTLEFRRGRVHLSGETRAEIQLSIDVSDLSSLLMGAVPLRRLTAYGLAELSHPAYLDQIDRFFTFLEKPVCHTGF